MLNEAIDQIARDAIASTNARTELFGQRLSDHIDRCEATGVENGKKLDGLQSQIRWIIGLIVAGQGAVILTLAMFLKG